MASNDAKIKDLMDKIKTWDNRAQVAKQQGNAQMTQMALDKKKEFENELSKLRGS